jgi:hypothetical protein
MPDWAERWGHHSVAFVGLRCLPRFGLPFTTVPERCPMEELEERKRRGRICSSSVGDVDPRCHRDDNPAPGIPPVRRRFLSWLAAWAISESVPRPALHGGDAWSPDRRETRCAACSVLLATIAASWRTARRRSKGSPECLSDPRSCGSSARRVRLATPQRQTDLLEIARTRAMHRRPSVSVDPLIRVAQPVSARPFECRRCSR